MIELVNNQKVDIKKLEILEYDELAEICAKNKFRCVNCAAIPYETDEDNKVKKIRVFYVVSNNLFYFLSSSVLDLSLKYNAISSKLASWVNFERELYENYNVKFVNHPFLKPIRFAHNRAIDMELQDYPFFKINGEGIHEVGVGPVHAGVIEPGHFRFMCRGEKIDHLEIQLGYQHRGITELLKNKSIWQLKTLIESIAGDSTVINGTLYASSVESLAQIRIPERAAAIRVIGIELERAALHFSTLSGIANDVAYLTGAAFAGATRTYVINSLQSICGNRFGHALIGIGGVNFDIDEKLRDELIATLTMVKNRAITLEENMLNSPSVLTRLENTGVITNETARKTGFTGVTAKAAGLNIDCRRLANNVFYNKYCDELFEHYPKNGDVLSRARQRFVEIKYSLDMVLDILKNLPSGAIKAEFDLSQIQIPADTLIFSFGEGPRGENSHLLITDNQGEKAASYIPRDPSFVNWLALALSVRGNQISDFPICNKSFDLSYCGSDL